MPKPYAIELKVRNNYLLEKMHERGFQTVAALTHAMDGHGHQNSNLGLILNLKMAAKNKLGNWRPQVLRLAEFLRCMPEDLFPPQHIHDPLEKNKAVIKADIADVQSLTFSLRDAAVPPLARIEVEETRGAILALLDTLTPRAREIVSLRFGLEGGREHTYREIGDMFGISVERARQIEVKALRSIRYDKRRSLEPEDIYTLSDAT